MIKKEIQISLKLKFYLKLLIDKNDSFCILVHFFIFILNFKYLLYFKYFELKFFHLHLNIYEIILINKDKKKEMQISLKLKFFVKLLINESVSFCILVHFIIFILNFKNLLYLKYFEL